MSRPQPPILPPISVGISANMSEETEKLIQCPYNPAHSILRYRMQTHLHRCRKQHECLDWGTCSHNGTHQMPRAEIEWHESNMCPDRHAFQAKFFTLDKDAEVKQSLAPMVHIPLPASEENWDDGVENHFDPGANAAKKSLIRGVHCVPPSERKAFKQSHRQHLRDNEEDVVTSARLKSDQMKQQARKPAPEPSQPLEPLRPPREFPKGFSFARGKVPDKVAGSVSPGASSPPAPSSQTQSVQWSGLGRGSSLVSEPRAPGPGPGPAPAQGAAPVGAWGRGRPKF